MKLEDKLKEFADIRNFANGLQRKELIDREVKVYLIKKVGTGKNYDKFYSDYKEMYLK